MINLQAAAIIFTPEDLPNIFDCKVCMYELKRDPDHGDLYWGDTREYPLIGSYRRCKRYVTANHLHYLGFRLPYGHQTLSFKKRHMTSRFVIHDAILLPTNFFFIVFIFICYVVCLPFFLILEGVVTTLRGWLTR